MKSGINQWAFPPEMPVMECMSYAKKMGFESFEVCVGEDGPTRLNLAKPDFTEIRRHADALGLTLHSVACGQGWQYPMSAYDPQVREKGIAITQRALQVSGWLGVKALLVVPGVVDGSTSYDAAMANALDSVRECIHAAEKAKVAIALENVWNKFLISPVEMRDFIDNCASEYVGAYVDVGNMIPYGYPEQHIRILGKRVRAIHMKDFRASVGTFGGFVMLLEGDVNWPTVMAALREVGYDGALTAEYGPYAHSLECMLQHVNASLTAIVKM